jgi:tRNA pseudouridine55 synthase
MRHMDGVLIIDKPAGFTSHDVVARARKILRERRIGHTGTLDPFATGVLVLLIGKATRLAQFVGSEKEYEAVFRLGFATETGDASGARLESTNPNVERPLSNEEIERALAPLRGVIRQIPPMYSAKKKGGRKLYQLARSGESIPRDAVSVTVYALEPTGDRSHLIIRNADGTADLKVRVVCSAGTYVRTLADDFGRLVGTPAHLAELRRTRAGDFAITNAITLEQLKQTVDEGLLGTILLPVEAALSRLPFVHLSMQDAQRARHGMAISYPAQDWGEGERIALTDEQNQLIGVASFDAEQQFLQPRVVVVADI